MNQVDAEILARAEAKKADDAKADAAKAATAAAAKSSSSAAKKAKTTTSSSSTDEGVEESKSDSPAAATDTTTADTSMDVDGNDEEVSVLLTCKYTMYMYLVSCMIGTSDVVVTVRCAFAVGTMESMHNTHS
jgi:hypothetical protein